MPSIAQNLKPSRAHKQRVSAPILGTPETHLDRWAFPAFLALLTLLCLAHALYLSQTKYPFTSPDEAHYSSGAVSIANGLRTRTLPGAWAGYRDALGFKPPLVCIPAGLFILLTHSVTLPFSLTLVFSFAALGLASYSLFRNCFRPFHAAIAATTLLDMPLITGLTHRYYVELPVLLLTVITVDLLVRIGWRTVAGSILIGLVLGLGVLAKTTFALFIVPPILFSMWIYIRQPSTKSFMRTAAALLAKLALAIVTSVVIAWPWYSRNFTPTLEHAKISALAANCYYRHWIAADLSSGPSILLTLFAAIGLAVIAKRLIGSVETAQSFRAWMMILLLALTTALGVYTSVNKATRFQVTWLPAFAALAVAAWYPFEGRKWFHIGPAVVALLATVLSLHNSFEILGTHPIGFGDVKLIDCRFPLNVPGWFDDNAPVDRRNYRLSEVEAMIAADALRRFPANYSPEARTTQSQLLINFYYFDFLSSTRRHPVHYMTWWQHSWITGPQAADYIVYTKNFDKFYPGSQNLDFYPGIEADVAQHRIPYRELFRVNGPTNSEIVVLSKE